MFDRDTERQKRKARRNRDAAIKQHKKDNQGIKPKKSERRLKRWQDAA